MCKTIILYRTALLANELLKSCNDVTEKRKLNNLIIDFNAGYHNTLNEDIDYYSVV